MHVHIHRHKLYLNERRRRYYEGDSRMKPTHQGLTCGSGAAAARRGAPLPALIRGLQRWGCSRWRRCKNQLIKRHCRLSSAAIWKESFPSFIYFFFTRCLFVSLLCFLCPLPRQRCRWIGAVSVRDLCVISWNAHPSEHKKLNFQLFELYCFFFFFSGISLTLCFTSKIKTLLHGRNIFYLSLWSTWTAKQRCQLASPINKLCKLKIVQSPCMKKVTTVRIYEYIDEM